MGWYVGSHADRNTGRAIDEQIRELGRQHRRLQHLLVIVRDHVDGLFVQIGQQFVGKLTQADLGVTHRSRAVAVDRTEVTLTVDQHVAEGKILSHTHDGVVRGSITMRVVLTDNVTDYTGRFFVRLVVVVAHIVHGVQATAVYRLEAVAHVRQGSTDDDRHGVIHVGAFHLVFNINRYLVDWDFCWSLH